MNNNTKLIDAQDVVIRNINHICSKFGLNNIMAQLYALLYVNNKSLSLDDMSERLKVSKASASINIRALEGYGAVRKVWVKGSRKDYYEAEDDIAKVIMERVSSMAKRRLLETDDMIKCSCRILSSISSLENKERKEATKVFRQRLDKLKRLHNKAQILFNLFNSGLLDNVLNGKLKRKNLI